MESVRIMSTTTLSAQPILSHPEAGWLTRHWFLVFGSIFGLWVWLPFLAPVLMHVGWSAAGKSLYFIYSFFCHQLPERSFFLFGRSPMYSLGQIQVAGTNTINPFLLRQFIGNASMGWKVAWSDRMISFYTSIWLFAVAWWPIRRKLKPLPWWAFALFLLPIVLDGGTHAVSDLAGIGHGFRDSNLWLAELTNNFLPSWFCTGDALGSFNSWMRLITGVVASLGLVWFAFPYVEESFGEG
jgi:uncharacterized membrane protein